eukprot:gene3003-5013_t
MNDLADDAIHNILYFLEPKFMFYKTSNVNQTWREASLFTLINPVNVLQDVFDKEVAQTYSEKAKIHFQKKKFSESIYYYTQSIKLDPSNPRTFSNRALCYIHQNLYQQAFDDLNVAISLDESWSKPVLQKAILLKKTGHEEEGKQCLTKSIDLSKKVNDSYIFLNTNSETYFDFKTREKFKQDFVQNSLDYYIADISTISNLCYIPIDKFFKKFNYQFGDTFVNFRLTASFVFDDVLLLRVSKKNPQIQSLNISGCMSITTSGIMYSIQKYLKNLKYLDIRNIPHLDVETINFLENKYEIEIIHSIYEENDDFDYKKYMDKLIFFEEKGVELANILNLNQKQLKEGIKLQDLNVISRHLVYEWHPDLNSLNFILNKQKLSVMNDLMDDLFTKARQLEENETTLVYKGKTEQTNFLQIGS